MNFKKGDKVKLNDPASDYHKASAVIVKVGKSSYDIQLSNGLMMRVVEDQLIGSSNK